MDLGSGTGKGVFAASLLYNFKKCIGIEVSIINLNIRFWNLYSIYL